ncbi:uncharacterized protein EI90DRAFT_3115182 [Cantharellus anzutake]|uniref:uncharacterized protein n=1 Tax=Cantharellus anzutake TaxID=1750568 RepID=UPI00190681A5|nr:uncharacterized protein EI90DRAFT_3115182 [Cantharellus anzutake]KAF8342602.1 hypothetical protein EI90DRAFT_3115182 [Cantharellus anzutake]
MATQESPEAPSVIIDTQPLLPDLRLISRGKVRDLYETSNPDAILFVASDRISAHDIVMRNGIPGKGKILTRISLFWLNFFDEYVSTHLITADVDEMPEEVRKYKDILQERSMLVRKAEVLPIEAIVRGYLTGSAAVEYQKSRTVHGIELPQGLRESEKLPQTLFTPSTKGAPGMHDENIHPNKGSYPILPMSLCPHQSGLSSPALMLFLRVPLASLQPKHTYPAADLLGSPVAGRVARLSVELYTRAAQRLKQRDVILADTKFEFGFVRSIPSSPSSPSSPISSDSFDDDPFRDKELVLVDEAVTPDSSRYWPLESFKVGQQQPSFDKQFLRDWLISQGYKKGLEGGPDGQGWTMSPEVVEETAQRYREAERRVLSR